MAHRPLVTVSHMQKPPLDLEITVVNFLFYLL